MEPTRLYGLGSFRKTECIMKHLETLDGSKMFFIDRLFVKVKNQGRF